MTFTDLDTFYCVLTILSVDLMQITKIQHDKATSHLNQIGNLEYKILCGSGAWKMKKGEKLSFFAPVSRIYSPQSIIKKYTFSFNLPKGLRRLLTKDITTNEIKLKATNDN